MSHSQFHSTNLFILRHAWLNLWDKHMTTGRINQVTTSLHSLFKGSKRYSGQWWPFPIHGCFRSKIEWIRCNSMIETTPCKGGLSSMGSAIKINLAIGLARFRSTSPRHLHGTEIMAYGGDYQQPACEITSYKAQSRRISQWMVADRFGPIGKSSTAFTTFQARVAKGQCLNDKGYVVIRISSSWLSRSIYESGLEQASQADHMYNGMHSKIYTYEWRATWQQKLLSTSTK